MEQQLSTSQSTDTARTTTEAFSQEHTPQEQASLEYSCLEPASLEATILTALCFNNAKECCRLAQEAAHLHDLGTIRALHALVNHRTLTGRQRFEPARIAAIEALATIGNISSLPILTAAILDRSPAIQQAASRAVLTYGPAATDALLATLERPGNWPLSGMKTLIATIGKLGQTFCAPALARVMIGQLPKAPIRWKLIHIVPATVTWSIIWLTLFQSWDAYSSVTLTLLMFPYLFLHALILIPIYLAVKNREQKEIIRMLDTAIPAMRDLRILPTMISVYTSHAERSQNRRIARRLLLELLPLLSGADMYTFPLYSRTQLVALLESNYKESNNKPLLLAILRALHYVGNAQAIIPLRRLAERSRDPQIRQWAAYLHDALEQRIRDAKSATHLLRPSQQPTAATDQLLRPTLHATNEPPEELLRPQQPEPAPLDDRPYSKEPDASVS